MVALGYAVIWDGMGDALGNPMNTATDLAALLPAMTAAGFLASVLPACPGQPERIWLRRGGVEVAIVWVRRDGAIAVTRGYGKKIGPVATAALKAAGTVIWDG